MSLPTAPRAPLGAASDDSALVAAVAADDLDAYGWLYDRYAPDVFRACRRHRHERADAQDAMSATFLEAWRCRTQWAIKDDSARPWLLGVAHNVARTQNRVAHRHHAALQRYHARELAPGEPDPTERTIEALTASDNARQAWLALAQLPERQRDVVVLHLIEEHTLHDTAHTLGMTPTAAKSTLARARRTLRALLHRSEQPTPEPPSGHHQTGHPAPTAARSAP